MTVSCLLFCLFHSVGKITDDEAREALLAEIGKHCCYGKGAANSMVFTSIIPSSAYHVSSKMYPSEQKKT